MSIPVPADDSPVRDLHGELSREDIEDILHVTRALAAPFDLATMLDEVSASARRVLHAERSSVWLLDADGAELVLKVANDLQGVRVRSDAGLLGACIASAQPVNVPDCYADSRFDRTMDSRTGFHTRCSLTVPLVDHAGTLIGAMQLLNRHDGVFEPGDVTLAQALAAQCAVALSRVQLMEATVQAEKMQRELELARVVQMSTLPAAMPRVEGYDLYGCFRPADLTGGDTFDLANVGEGVLVLLADATGHGIAPALDVTRMHAMLVTALGMGADLNRALVQVNNQLARTLPEDRFVTAFIGMLDPGRHRLSFHSAGQAPLLMYHARAGECVWLQPTSFPLAAMPLRDAGDPVEQEMAPGDVLVLLSDGVYEYCNPADEQFGTERVAQVVRAHAAGTAAELAQRLLEAVREHAAGAAQDDDITIVLVKRDALPGARRDFERQVDSLTQVFEFTAAFAREHAVGADVLGTVDFVVEELFTNMVKYSTMSRARVTIVLRPFGQGAEVEMVDYDVDPFDVTEAPDAQVELPLAERRPGGLGLHLIRRLVDHIEYRYDKNKRESHTIFRKAGPS